MEITGTLKLKKAVEQKSDKFKKLEFVITDSTNPSYPQHISMQITNDKCGMLDNFTVGDKVTAHINIRGREWTSPGGEVKYFNTIEAWKVVLEERVTTSDVAAQTPEPNPNIVTRPDVEIDQLPF